MRTAASERPLRPATLCLHAGTHRDTNELAAVRANTQLLHVESPSNPLLRCMHLAALANLGRERGLLTVIDNTFATPIRDGLVRVSVGLEDVEDFARALAPG